MLLTEGDWGSENQNLVWLSYLRSPRNQSKSVRHLVRQSWKRPSSLVWSDSSVVSAPSVSLLPPLLLSPSRSPIGLGTWIKGGERERGRAAEEGREEAREREGPPLPSSFPTVCPGGPDRGPLRRRRRRSCGGLLVACSRLAGYAGPESGQGSFSGRKSDCCSYILVSESGLSF